MLLLYTNAVVHYKLSLYLRVETDPEATDFGKLVNNLPFKHGVLLKFLRLQLALIEVNDLLQVDKVKVFQGTCLPPTYVSHLLELVHSRYPDSVLLCSVRQLLCNTNYFKPGENVDTLT